MQQDNNNRKLFSCKCGYSCTRSRKAMKHLEQTHEIKELLDGDFHLTYYGKFTCSCGRTFTSDMITIIYKSGILYKLMMNCLHCHRSAYPIIKINTKKLSDDVITLLCRWKLTQGTINGFRSLFGRRVNHNHQREECQACSLGLCGNNMIPDDVADLNATLIKVFVESQHQVKAVNNIFEVLSIQDSLNSDFSYI